MSLKARFQDFLLHAVESHTSRSLDHSPRGSGTTGCSRYPSSGLVSLIIVVDVWEAVCVRVFGVWCTSFGPKKKKETKYGAHLPRASVGSWTNDISRKMSKATVQKGERH